VAAHTHHGELSYPIAPNGISYDIPLISSGSISPIFANNPAYSTLDLGDQIESFTQHSLQLYAYIFFRFELWSDLSYDDFYNFSSPSDLNSATKVRSYFKNQLQSNAYNFASYVGGRMGFSEIPREIGGYLFTYIKPLMTIYFMEDYQLDFICSLMYFSEEDYQTCSL
jgi:hypothetical protein